MLRFGYPNTLVQILILVMFIFDSFMYLNFCVRDLLVFTELGEFFSGIYFQFLRQLHWT